jgi:hypothetical protein
MSLTKQSCITLVTVFLLLTACTGEIMVRSAALQDETDKLIVHTDGSMVFRDKTLPVEDVIIYHDGSKEKAAVKMYVPLHPGFFRDSIIVERLSPVESTASEIY